MTMISIREHGARANGANATISFDGQGEYPVTISDPFTEEEEVRLEWYFEEYLRFPFVKQVEAQSAAASITAYGEALFHQIFANPEAYACYKEALRAGLNTIQLEVAGSPEFHRLHWEALKDPNPPQPLTLHAVMVRKNLIPQPMRAVLRPSPTINLLIIAARPHRERDMGYRTISRPLVEGLRQANLRMQIEILRPGTFRALVDHLEEVRDRYGAGYYHIIHFDVHGGVLTYQEIRTGMGTNRWLCQTRYGRTDLRPYEGRRGFLFFEGDGETQADPVEAGELAALCLSIGQASRGDRDQPGKQAHASWHAGGAGDGLLGHRQRRPVDDAHAL
jgi:hypothetical protein